MGTGNRLIGAEIMIRVEKKHIVDALGIMEKIPILRSVSTSEFIKVTTVGKGFMLSFTGGVSCLLRFPITSGSVQIQGIAIPRDLFQAFIGIAKNIRSDAPFEFELRQDGKSSVFIARQGRRVTQFPVRTDIQGSYGCSTTADTFTQFVEPAGFRKILGKVLGVASHAESDAHMNCVFASDFVYAANSISGVQIDVGKRYSVPVAVPLAFADILSVVPGGTIWVGKNLIQLRTQIVIVEHLFSSAHGKFPLERFKILSKKTSIGQTYLLAKLPEAPGDKPLYEKGTAIDVPLDRFTKVIEHVAAYFAFGSEKEQVVNLGMAPGSLAVNVVAKVCGAVLRENFDLGVPYSGQNRVVHKLAATHLVAFLEVAGTLGYKQFRLITSDRSPIYLLTGQGLKFFLLKPSSEVRP